MTPAALATLYAILAGDDPASVALRKQIPHVKSTSGCNCGCPTLDLTVDRDAVEPAPVGENPAVSAWYDEPSGAGVLLFTRDGYMSLLELYSVEIVREWPDPAGLTRDP